MNLKIIIVELLKNHLIMIKQGKEDVL